jgi:16S rRNA processing protein RimM
MTNDQWLEVGKIVGAQGLQGDVRVYPNSDFPERFLKPGQRWLRYPDRPEPQGVYLLRGRYLSGKGLYVVKLDGIHDRTQAEALQGCMLLVLSSDRPQLDTDEFHVQDLLGLQVFHQITGAAIGIVINVITAGNDLLVVTPASTPSNNKSSSPDQLSPEQHAAKEEQLLIPFVKEIVPVVDLEQRRIEITPPTGLIPGY